MIVNTMACGTHGVNVEYHVFVYLRIKISPLDNILLVWECVHRG